MDMTAEDHASAAVSDAAIAAAINAARPVTTSLEKIMQEGAQPMGLPPWALLNATPVPRPTHGGYSGHILPGVAFVSLGFWWLCGVVRVYAAATPQQPFVARAWYPVFLNSPSGERREQQKQQQQRRGGGLLSRYCCCCFSCFPLLPLEPCLIFALCLLGVNAELWLGHDSFRTLHRADGYLFQMHLAEWQHVVSFVSEREILGKRVGAFFFFVSFFFFLPLFARFLSRAPPSLHHNTTPASPFSHFLRKNKPKNNFYQVMYLAFCFSALVSLLAHLTSSSSSSSSSPPLLPRRAPQFALAGAFALEFALFAFHLEGTALDVRAHLLLVVTIGCCAALSAVEALAPENSPFAVEVAAAKAFATWLQGCWFIALAEILFKGRRAMDPRYHGSVMFLPAILGFLALASGCLWVAAFVAGGVLLRSGGGGAGGGAALSPSRRLHRRQPYGRLDDDEKADEGDHDGDGDEGRRVVGAPPKSRLGGGGAVLELSAV